MDIMDMPKMKGTETKKGYEITPEYFLVIEFNEFSLDKNSLAAAALQTPNIHSGQN